MKTTAKKFLAFLKSIFNRPGNIDFETWQRLEAKPKRISSEYERSA